MRDKAKKLNDPEFWFGRARETRQQAMLMADPEERRQMLDIAHAFERLAERIAKRKTNSLH